jgi:hypothetical protein
MTDAELASSTDGGKTFTNRRVSSTSFDSKLGPKVSLLHGADFGSKLGLDSWGNKAVAAWTDTREGTPADDAQDIATARISLAENPPFLGKWLVILVLFAVGAAALVAARREAQRTPEPEEAKEGARA